MRSGPRFSDEEYADTGCELAPRCLACPLPDCKYTMPPGRAKRLIRTMQLTRLLDTGLNIAAAAVALGISRRAAYRLIQQRKAEGGTKQ
ncbi:MAG: hypothetical protein AB7R89_28335 [Dehalococcoidia bacterium]